MTDQEVQHALNDLQALVCTLYGEARNQGEPGLIAVGCVIRNRKWAGCFGGDTYRAVCLARWQFSCWTPAGGRSNYETTMALARQLLAPVPAVLPRVVQDCLRVARGVLSGEIEDVTGSATHYMTKECYAHPPSWATTMRVTDIIGNHVFMVGVPAHELRDGRQATSG